MMNAQVETAQVETAQLRTNNTAGGGTINIALTRHSVEVLSSGLYSNVEMALVRELWVNALEVTPDPDHLPVVTAPSPFTPQLEVRDYGPGLTEEEVQKYYCTFFGTTKDFSEVGGFGLGCKTPFAMGDVFTIVSYQNGTATSYTIYKYHPETGLPGFVNMGSAPTDKPDGLLIRVPITPDKIDAVAAAVNDLRKYIVHKTEDLMPPDDNGVRFINIPKSLDGMLLYNDLPNGLTVVMEVPLTKHPAAGGSGKGPMSIFSGHLTKKDARNILQKLPREGLLKTPVGQALVLPMLWVNSEMGDDNSRRGMYSTMVYSVANHIASKTPFAPALSQFTTAYVRDRILTSLLLRLLMDSPEDLLNDIPMPQRLLVLTIAATTALTITIEQAITHSNDIPMPTIAPVGKYTNFTLTPSRESLKDPKKEHLSALGTPKIDKFLDAMKHTKIYHKLREVWGVALDTVREAVEKLEMKDNGSDNICLTPRDKNGLDNTLFDLLVKLKLGMASKDDVVALVVENAEGENPWNKLLEARTSCTVAPQEVNNPLSRTESCTLPVNTRPSNLPNRATYLNIVASTMTSRTDHMDIEVSFDGSHAYSHERDVLGFYKRIDNLFAKTGKNFVLTVNKEGKWMLDVLGLDGIEETRTSLKKEHKKTRKASALAKLTCTVMPGLDPNIRKYTHYRGKTVLEQIKSARMLIVCDRSSNSASDRVKTLDAVTSVAGFYSDVVAIDNTTAELLGVNETSREEDWMPEARKPEWIILAHKYSGIVKVLKAPIAKKTGLPQITLDVGVKELWAIQHMINHLQWLRMEQLIGDNTKKKVLRPFCRRMVPLQLELVSLLNEAAGFKPGEDSTDGWLVLPDRILKDSNYDSADRISIFGDDLDDLRYIISSFLNLQRSGGMSTNEREELAAKVRKALGSKIVDTLESLGELEGLKRLKRLNCNID